MSDPKQLTMHLAVMIHGLVQVECNSVSEDEMMTTCKLVDMQDHVAVFSVVKPHNEPTTEEQTTFTQLAIRTLVDNYSKKVREKSVEDGQLRLDLQPPPGGGAKA